MTGIYFLINMCQLVSFGHRMFSHILAPFLFRDDQIWRKKTNSSPPLGHRGAWMTKSYFKAEAFPRSPHQDSCYCWWLKDKQQACNGVAAAEPHMTNQDLTPNLTAASASPGNATFHQSNWSHLVSTSQVLGLTDPFYPFCIRKWPKLGTIHFLHFSLANFPVSPFVCLFYGSWELLSVC